MVVWDRHRWEQARKQRKLFVVAFNLEIVTLELSSADPSASRLERPVTIMQYQGQAQERCMSLFFSRFRYWQPCLGMPPSHTILNARLVLPQAVSNEYYPY